MSESELKPGNPLNLRITIRMTVLSAIVLATVLTAAVAIGLQYYFGYRLVTDTTRAAYATAASGIAAEVRASAENNDHLLALLARYAAAADGLQGEQQLRAVTSLMLDRPIFYGIYLGRDDGRFFEVLNLAADPNVRPLLQALDQDRWVIIEVEKIPDNATAPGAQAGRSRRLYRYLDGTLKERARRTEVTDFDPRLRPWYRAALDGAGIHRTSPYLFDQLGMPGRTLAMQVPGEDAVVAIDLTLSSISSFLAELQLADQSEVLLYDPAGEILASSEGGSALQYVSVEDLLTIANDPLQQERLVEVVHRGEPYLAYGAPLEFKGDQTETFLGILTPRAAVMGPFLERLKFSIAVVGGVLLLLLPLSWFLASPIVNPVRLLSRENLKVMRREYDTVQRIPSNVLEMDQLSESMMTMVEAIRDHERAQEELMESIIRLIAQAIDDKSPYTGGHCERVPELALMLARRASESDDPPFDSFRLETEDQWREFRIAAWLHDCGKLTTPEHIVDKGSKLEVIYNRIHEVRTRFEVLWRDAEIDYLKDSAKAPGSEPELRQTLQQRRRQLQEDFTFVATCNVGGEELAEDHIDRLREIAQTTWVRHFDDSLGLSPSEALRTPPSAHPPPATERLLSDKPEHIQLREAHTLPPGLGIRMEVPEHVHNHGELYNLSISRGTLTPEDRFRIKEHMISTIKMLDGLPFPTELSKVPRLASTHHETMKGTGYPRRLTREELSIEERILAIADVFEALTAADRPYKQAKTVGDAVEIMHRMVQADHLDRDCFELFLRSGIHRQYAGRFLPPEQHQEVDLQRFLAT